MSVGLLFCEGGKNSPDITILRRLAGENMVVESSEGGKFGFAEYILAEKVRRGIGDPNTRYSPAIAGIRDRDYDFTEDENLGIAHQWISTRRTSSNWVGWYWERKEIENYLIDPVIVEKALHDLHPDMQHYRRALAELASTYSYYTAARIALSFYRTQLLNRPNRLDVEPLPYATDADCREAIRVRVAAYLDSKHRTVTAEMVLEKYEEWLPRCLPEGDYFTNYLVYFPGKRLIGEIKREIEADPRKFGFSDKVKGFEQRVVTGIRDTLEEVWSWLPEWEALRQGFSTYPGD